MQILGRFSLFSLKIKNSLVDWWKMKKWWCVTCGTSAPNYSVNCQHRMMSHIFHQKWVIFIIWWFDIEKSWTRLFQNKKWNPTVKKSEKKKIGNKNLKIQRVKIFQNEIWKRNIAFGTVVRRSVRPNVQKSKIEGRGRPYTLSGQNDKWTKIISYSTASGNYQVQPGFPGRV